MNELARIGEISRSLFFTFKSHDKAHQMKKKNWCLNVNARAGVRIPGLKENKIICAVNL